MSNRKLPEDWIITTLGTFMDFKNGVNANKEAYGKGVKFINVMDIFRKNTITSKDVIGSVLITEKELEENSVIKGDILFNRTSETTNEISYSSIYIGDEKITFGGFVIRGRQIKKLIQPEYAMHCFKTDAIRKEMIRRCQGAVRANIGQKDLSKIPIVIPPHHEQKTIADLLSTWDVAIEKTEALITAKQQQFDWLHLNLILNAKNTTLKHFSDFLNESRIIDNSNDAQKRLTVRLHLKGVEVRECRGTEIEGATQYFVRKTGQLIYGKQNIFRGSIGIVSEKLNGYSSSQDIPAFDIAESIYPDWLFWYMSRLHFYKKLENFSAGSGSKRLHSKELFKIKIPIPAFPEQKRIAKILNTAKQEINSLKSLTKQYRTQKRGLMQKLLTGKSRINPKIINQHKEA